MCVCVCVCVCMCACVGLPVRPVSYHLGISSRNARHSVIDACLSFCVSTHNHRVMFFKYMESKNLIRNVKKCQFKTALPPTNVRFECGHKHISIYPINRGNVKCDFKAHNQSWWEFSVLRY